MGEERSIETILEEQRHFDPPQDFSEGSHLKSTDEYEKLYKHSLENPEEFWAEMAEELHWFRRWDNTLNSDNAPFYKWYENGKTNITYNCIDRHLENSNRNKAAIVWEGEPGDQRVMTYWDLYREVNKLANALKKLGIKKGDRVAVYLPMVPELVISVHALARLGAIHSVIFAGFSAESIRDRVLDCNAKMVITADGAWRRGNVLPLKNIVDEAIADCECVSDVIIVRRSDSTAFPCHVKEGRDHWYHRIVDGESITCPPEEMDSEDILFLLYTSGTTGKPKGIIHTTGGYMVYTYLTSKYVFDLKPEDVFWCTADVGWITGHSYLVYGPLANAATCLMYEGSPDWPDRSRMWAIIEKYGVSIFYTAPTLIRTFMRWGKKWPQKYDLSRLRLLGTVGEPINPEAWVWYYKHVGQGNCPIVDTWWQTETGGIMITPLPGITYTKPGSATRPFFGVDACILNDDGKETDSGYLAIRKPWPGILRGIYGDPERFKETYWSKWDGHYFPGDGAKKDRDGYFWILGRVDDVVNVSGHRIGTAELESVFVEHEDVAEAAVVGVGHKIKGQGLIAFVSTVEGVDFGPSLEKELVEMVAGKIGKFALPEKIIFTADMPKTRSGKIMRRLLRDLAEGNTMGNISTLADPEGLYKLKAKYEEA
ncbi:MAG: acetate--CoA ligase [candidate division Zixibacteria bacterium]|nr:acetate--CoA ligase [candidate division Zixibacteria bacterium]